MQPVPQPALETGWTLSYTADVTSLVGMAITVIGFGVTIWNVLKSRSAAEAAEKAAKGARSQLLRVDSIASIAGVITGLEDIKRLHRSKSWDGMPERYGTQRRTLIAVRTSNFALTDPQKSTLQSAINQLSMMEKQVEEHLSEPEKLDAARFNAAISKQADHLTQLLAELKIDGDHHEQ